MGILVEFFMDARHMEFKSIQEGRPIYEDREFIRIVIPGDRGSELVREVLPKDREEYGEVYDRFKRGLAGADQMSGTPLKQWPSMRPSEVRELNGLNIFTVEQLATLSDSQKQQLGMGAHDLVRRAQAFLEVSEKSGLADRHIASENAMKQKIAELEDRIDGLLKAREKKAA